MSKLSPGETVRDARLQRQLTRDQLAAAASVSPSMVARLELEDRLPNVLALTRIAGVVDLSIDEIVRQKATQ